MVDNNYRKIKERMKRRSMELWGIEDEQMVDPVIEMFLDVFTYELSKIYQEVKISDAKLLERIAKILVNENWSLPMPSHALLSVQPSEEIGEVDKTTQLYFQKIIQGDLTEVFFTPIKKHKLIKASVYCTAIERQLTFNNDKSVAKIAIESYKESRVPDYTIWVALDIEGSLLKKIDELPLSIILGDSYLAPYLKMAKIRDYDGNELEFYQENEDETIKKEHYYTAIKRYYQDYLFTLDLTKSSKKRHSLIQRCSSFFNKEELEEFDKDLFWLEISFPVAFNKEELDKIDISLNTFPIINRKFSYKQHDIRRNGKIFSLFSNDDEYFLNVESLVDNTGETYKSALKNDITNLQGSYSLYFGDLEQFDERNAKSILNQVIQTVREEGSSFSAVGYDLLNAYLEDLNSKLDELEKKVNFRYKNVSDNSEKLYLLTIPYDKSSTYECSYWTTNAALANGIEKGSLLSQYQTIGLQAGSIRLQTDTVGGMVKNGSKEKISSLRYGLISKDRIISNEDIKEFISMTVGKIVNDITVKSGVGISTNKKQGLVRTINVEVVLRESENLSNENKRRLGHSLELELQSRSVHNTPYRISII